MDHSDSTNGPERETLRHQILRLHLPGPPAPEPDLARDKYENQGRFLRRNRSIRWRRRPVGWDRGVTPDLPAVRSRKMPEQNGLRHPCRPPAAANPSGIIAKGGIPLNAGKVHGDCFTYGAGGIGNQ